MSAVTVERLLGCITVGQDVLFRSCMVCLVQSDTKVNTIITAALAKKLNSECSSMLTLPVVFPDYFLTAVFCYKDLLFFLSDGESIAH